MATFLSRSRRFIKIKRGKQELYLKDEQAMIDYLTTTALDGAGLHVNADAPGITGSQLEALVNQYRNVMKRIDRLARVYPIEVLKQAVNATALQGETSLKDRVTMENWIAELQKSHGRQGWLTRAAHAISSTCKKTPSVACIYRRYR
ncbi:hypothetical protein HAALTHF_09140n [Vreelandella aquamarina]|nr:hypothetical protein HAALTHF_09140n [Halomonas axialensis]